MFNDRIGQTVASPSRPQRPHVTTRSAPSPSSFHIRRAGRWLRRSARANPAGQRCAVVPPHLPPCPRPHDDRPDRRGAGAVVHARTGSRALSASPGYFVARSSAARSGPTISVGSRTQHAADGRAVRSCMVFVQVRFGLDEKGVGGVSGRGILFSARFPSTARWG